MRTETAELLGQVYVFLFLSFDESKAFTIQQIQVLPSQWGKVQISLLVAHPSEFVDLLSSSFPCKLSFCSPAPPLGHAFPFLPYKLVRKGMLCLVMICLTNINSFDSQFCSTSAVWIYKLGKKSAGEFPLKKEGRGFFLNGRKTVGGCWMGCLSHDWQHLLGQMASEEYKASTDERESINVLSTTYNILVLLRKKSSTVLRQQE